MQAGSFWFIALILSFNKTVFAVANVLLNFFEDVEYI